MLHVDLPTRSDIEALIRQRGAALVSLYLPTTPITQDAQADRIALGNLVREAKRQLEGRDDRAAAALEELLLDLADDDDFWAHQANSLAVFATPDSLRTFRLANRLSPTVQVSDRFHVKPLLRAVTTPQSAFVLALAANSVRVFAVSPDLPVFEVAVDALPKDAPSSVGKTSIRGRSPSGRLQGSEGTKVRLAQYARQVDHALRDLLGGRETPLILAAAEPLRSIYRAVQSYPHLAAHGIEGNPETVEPGKLAAATREILDAAFRDELDGIRALFERRTGEGRTTTDVAQAARAATRGAVQTLLVDIDDVMPGTLDDDGAVTFAAGEGATSYGVVDEIAGRALLTGARVLGVRRAEIPGNGSLAAILRYPA